MPQKTKTDYTESGQKSKNHTDIGKIITETSAWARPACKTDQEIVERIAEYQNLCAAKETPPYIEDLCLFLGISTETMHEWRRGETCSNTVKAAIDQAFTWVLSIDNKLTDAQKKNYVMRIWQGKQWHGEREPNSKLEDLLAVNLLKDLPSTQSIATKYLEDITETEN